MKIIHINKNIIQYNSKHGTSFPVCRVEEGKEVTYCMEVDIKGESKMVYKPDCPRACGAKLWIETEAEVEMTGIAKYSDFEKMKESRKKLL